jgi:hypothetical protein
MSVSVSSLFGEQQTRSCLLSDSPLDQSKDGLMMPICPEIFSTI